MAVRNKRKLVKRLFIGFICLLLVTEISLRYFWGFCQAVLFREDPSFEYIAIPQERVRLGHKIFYNSFSQRSPEPPAGDSIVVDGFGDSVINGGSQVDDDSLATTKLSEWLTSNSGKPVSVLNISSQSWGPDNCFAYLKKYGDFHARSMFLVASSHDVYDNMSFQPVVGVNPSFPSKQYPLALIELFDRYLIPKLKTKSPKISDEGLAINKRTATSTINSGILALADYARTHNIPFFIYHHADRQEYKNRAYNPDGMTLDSLCRANNIRLVRELDHDITEEAYRDNIHLSAFGQQQMFTILRNEIMIPGIKESGK